MNCTVKGCCNSASIDPLCLAHYAEIKDVTLTEAILERNRRAKDRFEAELKLQMGIQKIRMGDESRAALIQAAAKPKCAKPDCMRNAVTGEGLCADHHRCWEPTADYKRRREAFIQRSTQHNHNHDICMCGQPHSTHGDYTGCMTTWGYLAGDLSITEAAAKPKEEKRYSQILQEPDDHNPWASHPCAEEGCKMDGHKGYGYLCRDHYYERKPEAAVTIWARIKGISRGTVAATALFVSTWWAVFVLGEAIWLVLAAIPFAFGVWVEAGVLGLENWKRADKPRIPTKGAAKTKPFTLPDAEQP